MRLAIMQPYLFPYLGYFQLIQSVDTFVVYDDVNFIRGGWINRNYILSQGKPNRVTLQLAGASPNLQINQVRVGNNKSKLLKTIQQSYSKAPQYASVYPLVENILQHEEENLAKYIDYSLRNICNYLNITPQWHLSSDLQKDDSLRGQDKVLAICKELEASHYINVLGGRELYDQESFIHKNMKLSFIAPKAIEYQQFGREFVPNLSIVDVMMFNDQEQCSKLLQEYSLA